MPARYECLCAETVPYGLAAIREDKIRKCMREGCLQWQHVACSSDPDARSKARELVRCNGCYMPPPIAPAVQKEPTPEPLSKFVNIDDKRLTAAEAMAKALRETKALMARQKEERRFRELAEQKRVEAEKQAKIVAEQARVAKVKAEAEAAAAARAAKIAEEKAAEKHADELRKKRKREEGARYEEQQAEKRKLELIKQRAEEKKRAEIERLAQLKREIEERKVAQEFEAKAAKEAKETDEAKLKRKREKYQAQLAGLKEKIERTEGAKPEVTRAVMVSARASESGAQTSKGDAAEAQSGRRLSTPTSKGHAFSGQSNWSRPSGSGQHSVRTGSQPRTPFGNAHSHKPGRQSFSAADFTSTQSQPRVTGSMREHPSPSGQPARVKLLDQLKTSATRASTSTPTSTYSQAADQTHQSPQFDGTFDTNETMSTNDRVAQWCAENSMRAAKAYKGTRKVNPDNAIDSEISADQQEFPIEINESESESSDEEMIELPVLHPEINCGTNLPKQPTSARPATGIAAVEAIWSHNYNNNIRASAPSTATVTPPKSNAELDNTIFRVCSTFLWASYCDLPEGPEESKKATQLTKLDEAPEEWLEPMRTSILSLLQAEKETGREGLLDVLAQGNRVEVIKALSAEVMFQCYHGAFKGRKRIQLGILLEVVGMAMRGTYWDP
nr:hypothetical protein B0A51_09996 [Rachicladosporium sp. CCFEE 5018]